MSEAADPTTESDLRLYKVKVWSIKDYRNASPDCAPELRVYAGSEDHARFRARRTIRCCGMQVCRVELLESDVADYGDSDYE